jgi:hypothetical protein
MLPFSACVPASRNVDMGWLTPLSYSQAMPCIAFSSGTEPGFRKLFSMKWLVNEPFLSSSTNGVMPQLTAVPTIGTAAAPSRTFFRTSLKSTQTSGSAKDISEG